MSLREDWLRARFLSDIDAGIGRLTVGSDDVAGILVYECMGTNGKLVLGTEGLRLELQAAELRARYRDIDYFAQVDVRQLMYRRRDGKPAFIGLGSGGLKLTFYLSFVAFSTLSTSLLRLIDEDRGAPLRVTYNEEL